MITLLAILTLAAVASAQSGPVPGWFLSGADRTAYEIAIDHETFHGGSGSATIRCAQKRCRNFGTMMQTIRADRYIGGPVRLSGWVKASKAVEPRLWMRIDGSSSEMLAFDNMENRKKSGTFDWRRQEIVLDVMPPAALVNFGVILGGNGQAWVDDVVLEAVDGKVKSTNRLREPSPPRGDPGRVRRSYEKSPLGLVNGDFEQAPAERTLDGGNRQGQVGH